MSWSRNEPPRWARDAQATNKGWAKVVNGKVIEVLVFLKNLASTHLARPSQVKFIGVVEREGNLCVQVRFTKPVDVQAGANIIVSSTQSSGDIALHAAAATNVTLVEFKYENDNTTLVTIPDEPGELSIDVQDIAGDVEETVGGAPANKTISSARALEAGVKVLA